MNPFMKELWNKQQEIDFFKKALEVATPEQLFYVTKDRKYYAYWPKKYDGAKTTLQSRNAFIGTYTEKWSKNLFSDFAKEVNGYAVDNVICEEIGLTNQSPADLAICKTKDITKKPQNIY